jgi:hypothetical protein
MRRQGIRPTQKALMAYLMAAFVPSISTLFRLCTGKKILPMVFFDEEANTAFRKPTQRNDRLSPFGGRWRLSRPDGP